MGVFGSVEVAQADLAASHEEEVRRHESNDRRQENRERVEDLDERRGPVDELPWLDDPGRDESDNGSPPDVDVMGPHARKVDPPGDDVGTYVFKQARKGEAEGEEEDTDAGGARGLAVRYHDHEQVRGVPVDLAVDDLGGAGGDEAHEADEGPGYQAARDGADHIRPPVLCVTREVRPIRNSSRDARDGLVDGAYYQPRGTPPRVLRDRDAGVQEGPRAAGSH